MAHNVAGDNMLQHLGPLVNLLDQDQPDLGILNELPPELLRLIQEHLPECAPTHGSFLESSSLPLHTARAHCGMLIALPVLAAAEDPRFGTRCQMTG